MDEQFFYFAKGHRLSFELIEEIKTLLINKNSYNKIADIFKNSGIDRTTIQDIAQGKYDDKYATFTNKNYEMKLSHNGVIYVEVDDTYSKVRDENGKVKKLRNRLIVVHSGKDIEGKIADKIVVVEARFVGEKGANVVALRDKIGEIINQNFAENDFKLITYGDGARWINALAKQLNANFILDKFHLHRRIFDVFGIKKSQTKTKKALLELEFESEKSIYQNIIDQLNHSDFSGVIDYIESVKAALKDKISTPKIKEIDSLIRYLKSNKNGIMGTNIDENIGSHTESFVSRLIKVPTSLAFARYGLDVFKRKLMWNKQAQYIFI